MTSDREQLFQVRRTAARFAERHLAPVALAVDHADPAFPRQVFQLGLEAGFDRFLLPETVGGYGFGRAALCELIATLARACAGHAVVLGTHAAVLTGLHALKTPRTSEAVAALLDAAQPVALALPPPGSDAAWDTEPTPLALGWDPRGRCVCFTRTRTGQLAALLLRNEALPPTEPPHTLGLRALPLQELDLGPEPSDAAVLAEGETAQKLYVLLQQELCLVVSSAAAGLMHQAHRQALRYAAERYQGGRMIIDHSHLRTLLGAMATRTITAESAVADAAGRGGDLLRALAVKARVTRDAVACCTDAVQVLGGYGYMREYGLEKAMRDAAVLSLLPLSNIRAELWITARQKALLS